MPLLKIDPERCRKDGLCVLVCGKVFSQREKGTVPEVAREEYCNSCGHCVILCPSGAIAQLACLPENIHPVRTDLLPSYEQVREMIVSRRSVRAFRERPVEEEVMAKVIDGARFAPSAKNTQSTRYTVVRSGDLLSAIASTTASWLGSMAKRLRNPLWRRLYQLRGAHDAEEIGRWIGQFELIAAQMRNGRDLVLHGAPALLLFHAEKTVRFAEVNASLALQNGTMIAGSLGLGTFYTGYVVTAFARERALQRLVGLPKKDRVYGGLALGYPRVGFPRWIDRNPPRIVWL